MMTGVVCASSFLQKQAEIELKELRNKSFFGFFMLNALFVLIVFLLQLNKDELHIDWPLGIRENITIVPNTDEVPYYLWAVFFALVLVSERGRSLHLTHLLLLLLLLNLLLAVACREV